MSEFNITGWLKNHYLAEAGEPSSKVTSLVPLMIDAINQVDENLSYKDLAEAIGIILIEQYGSHNFQPFMGVLHSKIGMDENILKDITKQYRSLVSKSDKSTTYMEMSKCLSEINLICGLLKDIITISDEEIDSPIIDHPNLAVLQHRLSHLQLVWL